LVNSLRGGRFPVTAARMSSFAAFAFMDAEQT
jgi:hypothetical protein